MKSRSRGWMRGALLRGGSEARIPPRGAVREPPRVPAAEPCGRAGVTALEDLLPPAAGLSAEALERRVVVERLTPAEARLASLAGLATVPDERLEPELERDTLPEERDAELPERDVPVDGRETLPDERLEPELERDTLPEERLAELPEPEDLRFCVLTEGREAALFERDALVDGRDTLADERLEAELERDTLPEERLALDEGLDTLADERDEPEEDRETLEDERLAPPPYEERPALEDEDRETEDELRLEDDDEECPPPPRDWA